MMHGIIEQSRLGGTRSGGSDASTDEELLLGYRSRGDLWAFNQLVHRYEKELFGYLRHYLGSAEQAEDVFQQTFFQVHLKCEQFEPGRKVRPWLYTIATNQAIDLKRRNRRHRMASLDRRNGGELEDETGALLDLLDTSEPGPAQQAELAESREQVRRAVDDLPEAARQVVILVYFQGLKYREAAEVLAIPVGTVKSRLHAAIHKLSETLTWTRLPK
jgi:RNA polymerase sigma-70 factor (ECF subfamily)